MAWGPYEKKTEGREGEREGEREGGKGGRERVRECERFNVKRIIIISFSSVSTIAIML